MILYWVLLVGCVVALATTLLYVWLTWRKWRKWREWQGRQSELHRDRRKDSLVRYLVLSGLITVAIAVLILSIAGFHLPFLLTPWS